MRKLLMTCLLAAAPMTATASPCDTAEKGTYLSNVCFIMEARWRGEETVVRNADREGCTVETETTIPDPSGLFGMQLALMKTHKDFERREGVVHVMQKFYFNRVNLRSVLFSTQDNMPGYTCWELPGNGVGGHGVDVVSGCTRATHDRVKKAFENLYALHCEGVRSEF